MSITRQLRREVSQRFPRVYTQAANAKRWLFDPYERLLCRVGHRTNWTVATGPFAGMHYIRRNYHDRWAPRLIGSYEEELHPAIERAIALRPRNIVNIGAFEGYYSVGLARRLPVARVYAFELAPDKQQWCDEMAIRNGVRQRIEIRGECSAESLAAMNLDAALVVCDCEGAEEDILNPAVVPWLRTAILIVELHDVFRPSVTPVLTARFCDTNEFERIENRPRDAVRYSVLAAETPDDARLAVREDRVDAAGQPAPTPWGFWIPRGWRRR